MKAYPVSSEQLREIGKEFGLPLYVYHAETIIEQYKKLSSAFSDLKVKFKYACKANSNPAILRILQNLGCGLDTVSEEELRLGLQVGFSPEEIIFTPSCVGFKEIKFAAGSGVVVNIDNISILEEFGHTFGDTIPVSIRFNPHILAGGHHHISTGHIDSKFGISVHQLRHVERVVKTTGLRVEGLHMHTGSDILDVGVFMRGAEILFECCRHFEGIKFLDFGSGFKVAYKPGDIETDVVSLGKDLTKRVKEFSKEYGSEPDIWFEPGKYLVSEAGVFLVYVNVVKQTTATVFAGVNSGFNHLIRPMLYDSWHEIENVTDSTGVPRVYTVAGYICETDNFCWDRKIPEIREEDILCFRNAGAYGYAMASNYNLRVRPAEVLVFKGKPHLIRRRETLEDLLSTVVEIPVPEL